jgi:hypothetical protein
MFSKKKEYENQRTPCVCKEKDSTYNGQEPQPVRFAGLLWLKVLFAGLL